MVFSDAYTHSTDFIFARSDLNNVRRLEDLHGKKVAAVRGYATQTAMAEAGVSPEYVFEDTTAEALRLVTAGLADAFVGDLYSVSFNIEKQALTGIQIAAPTGQQRCTHGRASP